MLLGEILKGVQVTKLFSSMFGKMVVTQDLPVPAIRYDSRKVGRGDLFIAIRGTAVDGHTFVKDAIDRGATLVVVEDDSAVPDALLLHANVMKVLVPDSRKALATMAGNFYGHPSRALQLIGVTGTNGKTTTTHLVKSILESTGMKVGLIGTIEYKIGDEVIPSTHTTPESLELNQLLAMMRDRGCGAAVMEVSSHALAMSRVHGLRFAAAVFTNLTQDHLDFHGSMDDYFAAKKQLFAALDPDAKAVTNVDDPYGRRMIEGTKAGVITYSSRLADADVTAHDIQLDVRGLRFAVEERGGGSHPVQARLTARFNVDNLLAAYATGRALGIAPERVLDGIRNVRAVRGRFEQIVAPAGWTAVIDYAHTPDALEKCLHTLRELISNGQSHGRIITVFGCGGNRDTGKRPKMGKIAAEMSDMTFVTSDNPRKEDPVAIINDIVAGIPAGRPTEVEADRRIAIRRALEAARAGDIVLIAGKGHEDYQIIGDTKTHFDDREEVEQYIRSMR